MEEEKEKEKRDKKEEKSEMGYKRGVRDNREGES